MAPLELAQVFVGAANRVLQATACALEREFSALEAPELAHAVAHVKLGWWGEESARLRAGNPRHPLTRALLTELGEGAPAAALIDARLLAVARTLAGALPDTSEALIAQLAARHGLSASLLALPLAAAEQAAAADLGVASGLAEVILNVRADARRGRLRLPLAPLTAKAVEPEALSGARLPPVVTDLLAELAGRSRAAHHSATNALSRRALAQLRSVLVEAALWQRRLNRAQAAAFAEGTAHARREALAELWLAWQTARRSAG